MGGGGLRILGHKKWHVWRRENIERVHRDEREHEEKQLRLQAKQRGIEQEWRARTLQHKNDANAIEQDDTSVPPREHINFFKQEEEQLQQQHLFSEASSSAGVRKRDHKSSRHSQETLGQHGHLPWYAKRSAGSEEGDAADTSSNGRDFRSRGEQKRKRALEDRDPLKHMRPRRSSSTSSSADEREGLYSHRATHSRDAEERTERVYKSDFSRFSAASELRQTEPDDTQSGDPKAKKPKNFEKDRKQKSKSKRSNEKESVMQQLRREREEREQRERKRAEVLMGGR